MFNKLDLHAHTTASDGTLTPTELIAVAVRHDLSVLAITDHDSTEGVPEALAAAHGTDLEVWPGIEISTDVPGGEVHVLGYLVDYQDASLQATLRTLRESRRDRARRMVDRLAQLGLSVSWQRVQEIAGQGAVGRPHVAQAMLEKGYVSSIAQAFDRYIGRHGPAYVERYRLTPEDAVRLIVRAKGLASLAHPVIIGEGPGATERLDLDALLPQLVPAGLAALEVYYPGYTPELSRQLLSVAARWNLVGTGGSDFHGRGLLTTGLGEVQVPDDVIRQVRERHAAQQQRPGAGPDLQLSA